MKRKIIWGSCGLVLLILVCLIFFIASADSQDDTLDYTYFAPSTEEESVPTDKLNGDKSILAATETTIPEAIISEEQQNEPYVSPVDFEALWEVNTDAYAWLYIPGTEISYPILQHPKDDSWYLKRNLQGKQDSNGTLFTEASYNGKDFSDPLTIVYGHHTKNGSLFGTLQEAYSSPERLAEHSEIVIYLPDSELHFEVFAAVPYDNRHILYNYDFSNKHTFRRFFNEILSIRALEAVFAEDASVQSDDQVLLLSTCLIGNRNKRFIVCGKLSQTISQ